MRPTANEDDLVDADRRRTRRRIAAVLGIGAAVAVIDQLSKQAALWHLDPHQPLPLVGDLVGLQLAFNTGAAFSLIDGNTWILSIVSAAVVIGVVIRVVAGIPPRYVIGSGLLLGGAAGNLFDRLVRGDRFGSGVVVDMINYGGVAIGNVADVAILAGVVLLAVRYARTEPPKRVRADAARSTTQPPTDGTAA
jgi:signal peptidase II